MRNILVASLSYTLLFLSVAVAVIMIFVFGALNFGLAWTISPYWLIISVPVSIFVLTTIFSLSSTWFFWLIDYQDWDIYE